MPQVNSPLGSIGIEIVRQGDSFRIWIDKGRGKYISLDLSTTEFEHVRTLFASFDGGVKPSTEELKRHHWKANHIRRRKPSSNEPDV